MGLELYCQSDPFRKNREKGAIFKYERKDFDELFLSVFHRSNDIYYFEYFKIEANAVVTIDSIGNVIGIAFKTFVFDSYYTSNNPGEKGRYNSEEICSKVKAEVRRTLTSTNGLWLPKLNGNRTISSAVMVKINFKSPDFFHSVTNPTSDVYYESIIQSNIGIRDSSLIKLKAECVREVDSLKNNKVYWAIEFDTYSNKYIFEKANSLLDQKILDLAKVYLTELERRFPKMEQLKDALAKCQA
ncbi:MAG: hypothetical protein K0S33_2451 [Bacteroidetes bacterium]|jgi:hypothetical protein|nr:hypothetical protein [Bacteroidota bacterium]